MALLLLTADQIIPPAGTPPGSIANPTLAGTYPVGQVTQPPSGTLGPAVTPDPWDDTTCRAVDLGTATFQAVAPRAADLPYLAHARQVNVDAKTTDIAGGNGWFAVVIGNRFPASTAPGGTRYIAHLVSLEGFEPYLVDQPAWPAGITAVRLVSLASWSFTSIPEGGNFAHLMANLAQPAAPPTGPPALLLRLPVPATPQETGSPAWYAQQALLRGYAALEYDTRVGDRTFAWYHGPLVPAPIAPFSGLQPFASSAAATIYDATTGTFDLSYAAGFELGRLMALSSGTQAASQAGALKALRKVVDLTRERARAAPRHRRRPHAAAAPGPEGRQRGVPRLARGGSGRGVAEARRTGRPSGGAGGAGPGTAPLGGRPSPVAPRAGRRADAGPGAGGRRDRGRAAGDGGRRQRTAPPPVRRAVRAPRARRPGAAAGVDPVLLRRPQLPRRPLRRGRHHRRPDDARRPAPGDGARGRPRRLGPPRARPSRRTILRQATPEALPEGVQPGDPVAGLLLRSAVVSGWPGLEVKAYAVSAGGQTASGPIPLLRMDRLAPDVLLCLFGQVPAWVEFDEPKEGLAFGVEDSKDGTGSGVVNLRYLDDSTGDIGATSGTLVPLAASFLRDAATNVLDVAAWQGQLLKAYQGLGRPAPAWGPAAFAVQMVRAPQQMIFQNQPNTNPVPAPEAAHG